MKKIFILALLLLLLTNKAFAVDYSKYDPKNINSINKAKRAFQTEFDKKRGTKEAEADYLKFKDFYRQAITGIEGPDVTKYMEAPEKNRLRVDMLSSSKYINYIKDELTKKYGPYGIGIVYDEGDFYFSESNKFLYVNFAPYLSKDWQELMRYETQFDEKQIEYDAHIIISKEEFKEIYEFYKQFLKKYPDFVEREDLRARTKSMKRLLKKNWEKEPNPVW